MQTEIETKPSLSTLVNQTIIEFNHGKPRPPFDDALTSGDAVIKAIEKPGVGMDAILEIARKETSLGPAEVAAIERQVQEFACNHDGITPDGIKLATAGRIIIEEIKAHHPEVIRPI